jgi:type II secretory pathway pseudopilin PulG
MAVLAIGIAVITPPLAHQIQRDREEELIHRGIQYRRAIREFAKRRGRYPTTVEELVESNNIRYLRKSYKDPMTGMDFRMLHAADIPAMVGVNPTLQNPQSTANSQPMANDTTAFPAPEQQTDATPTEAVSNSNSATSEQSSENPQQFGAPIVGVVSRSTKKTIREFERKNHYNQWLFFYDPGYDRPYEVRGPTPLSRMPANVGTDASGLQGAAQTPVPGQSPAPGQTQSPPPATPSQ